MNFLKYILIVFFLSACSTTVQKEKPQVVSNIDHNQSQDELINSVNEAVDAMTSFLVSSGNYLDENTKSLLDETFDVPERGIEYGYNAIKGIPYPKKNGKIYIQSTTLKDTQTITPENSQLYGFDNVVIRDVMQCDSLPEFTDVLLDHEWEIADKPDDADYIVSLSTTYCGWPKDELRASRRTLPIEKRLSYKKMLELSHVKSVENNITMQNNEFIKHSNYFNVKAYHQYFNPFENKYSKHLGSIRNMYRTQIHAEGNNMSSGYSVNSGSSEVDIIFALLGSTMQVLSSDKKNYRSSSGYETEIKVYNPETDKTDILYMDGFATAYSGYETYYHTVENFACGVFYK